jgi:endonuclease YncB( thermonuclease family)
VTVEEEGTDQYRRMLGTIYDGKLDVNAEQVRLGMAWVYRHYTSDPALLALEREARQAKRGLWANPRPVAPWEYRHSR